MTTICFAGTYPPLMCGIGDYTRFITASMDPGTWAVLSFRLNGGEIPLAGRRKPAEGPAWYGIPGPGEYSATDIMEGLRRLGLSREDTVLWFQHEFNNWQGNHRFVGMLAELDLPRVVTLHTLRFQSNETAFGLAEREYQLLRDLLPVADAVTVFSNGVYTAVTEAFPEYRGRVHVLRHGAHQYPAVARLETREKLHASLLGGSLVDRAVKEALARERVFLDPDTVILGQTGFLHEIKGSEFIFTARDELQELLAGKRVVAMRIGRPRLPEHQEHVHALREQHNGRDKFLLETWLPGPVLPVALRAFDVNYYWPNDCTQSGMLMHAFGAGGIVAGRELEGVGETLREAGALYDSDPQGLVFKIRDLVLTPEMQERVEKQAIDFARKHSWGNQARRHYQLAQLLVSPSRPRRGREPLPPPQEAAPL